MKLYGVYGSHTTESCPLFHEDNRKMVLEVVKGFEKTAKERGINVLGLYHSPLEHTFLWIFESGDAHTIQDLMVDSGIAKFNAIKIVPLRTLGSIVEYLEKI